MNESIVFLKNEDIKPKKNGDYKIVQFGDVAKKVSNIVDPFTSGLSYYVEGGDIRTDDLHIKTWSKIGSNYLGPAFNHKFLKGQILYISRNPHLRKVAIAPFDGICANTTFVIEPQGNDVIPELIPFIIQSEDFVQHRMRKAKGSTNPYINWKDMACYEFTVPEKDDQRRIATVLWAAEDCILKSEQFLNIAKRVKKLLVKKVFTDGINHSKFKQIAEIGEIPTDWRIVRLEDTSKEIIVPMRDKPKKFEGSIPWCRLEDIDGKYLYKSKSGQNVDADTISKMNLKVFPKGTLICACSAILGVCAIAGNPLITNQRFIGIVPNDSLDSEFLYYILVYYTPRLLAQSTGTIFCNIPRKNFENFIIPLPSLPEQRQIAAILTRCDETIAAARANVDTTRALKMQLINEMLTLDNM